jgi:broad specificity phosphatase PhoE
MSTETTRLYLVRHGEVEERYHKIFGGRIDMDLSDRGRQQASQLAGYLRRHPVQAVYASPMKRVQQTFAPYVELGGTAPRLMGDLREVDFGDWTGLGWHEVRERFGMSAFDWLEHLEAGQIPNAEPPDAYRARVQPCLRHILGEHPGEHVAVFCHGGVIRQLLALLLDLPLGRMAMFEVDYASLTVVDWKPGRVEIQMANFTPWRDLP